MRSFFFALPASVERSARAFQVVAEILVKLPMSDACKTLLPPLLSFGAFRSELRINFVGVDAEEFRGTFDPFDAALFCVEVVFNCSDGFPVAGVAAPRARRTHAGVLTPGTLMPLLMI